MGPSFGQIRNYLENAVRGALVEHSNTYNRCALRVSLFQLLAHAHTVEENIKTYEETNGDLGAWADGVLSVWPGNEHRRPTEGRLGGNQLRVQFLDTIGRISQPAAPCRCAQRAHGLPCEGDRSHGLRRFQQL